MVKYGIVLTELSKPFKEVSICGIFTFQNFITFTSHLNNDFSLNQKSCTLFTV